jgi:hypothetical protein
MDKEILKAKFYFCFRTLEEIQNLIDYLLSLKNKTKLIFPKKYLIDKIFYTKTKEHFKISYGNKAIEINGQDLKELFISLIYVKYLYFKNWKDMEIHNKYIWLAKIEDDSDIDSVIGITDNFNIGDNKIDFSKSTGEIFYFQIKEIIPQRFNKELIILGNLDLEDLRKKILSRYGNIQDKLFYVFYLRDFKKIDLNLIKNSNIDKNFLKHVILIGKPLSEENQFSSINFFIIHGRWIMNNIERPDYVQF